MQLAFKSTYWRLKSSAYMAVGSDRPKTVLGHAGKNVKTVNDYH
jgi:hypothetical protein